MSDIEFETFTEEDIQKLTLIMKRAFDEDTKIHLGREAGGPTGYDNGDFLRKWGLNKDSTQYKILLDKKIIGAVILWINKETNHNTLGTIFVDPELQEKGLGTKIWTKIEKMYPDTIVWNAETPIYSHRNHNFYVNKCGFHIIEIKNPKDMEDGSFILEKRMK
mgnify:CR=1 FL=1